MGKYLKLFKTHTEYQTYSGGGDMILPNVSYCKNENEVHYNPYVHDYSQDYLTFVAKADGTFQLSTNAVNYSLDNGTTWTELAVATASPTVTAGSKIMWKATLTPTSSAGIGTFSSTGQFDVEGNPMSLLYGDDFKGQTNLTGKGHAFRYLFQGCKNVVSAENLSLSATKLAIYCYYCMFENCTSLTTAPALPAITLAESCYSFMFKGCTSLTTAPELPATTLAKGCYNQMFSNCTSLTTAPALPATTLTYQCYNSMFNGCTNLTTAPALPATTLASSCYNGMFEGCTSLITAPELPATTLANGCYNGMFAGCTSLTTAPELPATTLADSCYSQMFSNCTSLTTAPALPATTLTYQCYYHMFNRCKSLNYIKAMFTTNPSGTPSTSYTSDWVTGVASSGTFVKNSAATWNNTGFNGIPYGWTVETASA